MKAIMERKVNSSERNTSQKLCILEFLKSTRVHPDAQTIYQEVKKTLPSVSKGTIYRNLESMVAMGKIKLIPGKQKNFYDADITEHAHFICQGCGAIQDLAISIKKILPKNKEIGIIRETDLYFFGLCKKCLINNKLNK